ncbi:MAG: MFS transporter [Rhizobiales bacterium]|nr:MFS transporter [Hyphomicrobiales bacterium]
MSSAGQLEDKYGADSSYSWSRLMVALLLSTIGGVGLWSTVVVLPVIQADFGIDRGGASLPYTATLIGYAIGGIFMGRAADRFGVTRPIIFGTLMLGLGYVAAAMAQSYWQFIAAQAILIGMMGSSATYGPLVADISHWFVKRRGIAVAIVISGNYISGAFWPPILQYGIETVGWRQSYMWVALLCVVTMIPLALFMRRRPNIDTGDVPIARRVAIALPTSPRKMQALLVFAGVACCVAMAMPQVHLVAMCVDLGYGAARGAEMLSVMLSLGIISRLISGMVADRIGGLATLLIGSTLQCIALLFYLPFDGLMSLYVIAGMFGLAQGGIVPSYALIVREYFPAREAGSRISIVLMSTIAGMALGGWMSGEIYDLTGSYQAAFLNGIAWNLLNMGIAAWLLLSRLRPRTPQTLQTPLAA